MEATKNEPLVTVSTITAGITAFLGLLVAFGVPLTQEQQIAILAVVAVAAPVVVGVIARNLVTPTANVLEYVDPKGSVIAGDANERVLPGLVIRQLDTPDPPGGHAADHGNEPEGDAL